MPLDFKEVEKPKEVIEFFNANKKTRPLELEGEVLPELIRRCGDVKSGRISLPMVEKYLDNNVLVFDRELLKNMFTEADFRKEGSLDAGALSAALSNRYPKRNFPREWRQLCALLMGIQDLVLAQDIKEPKFFDGTFNNESVWTDPPPELPKITRRKPKATSSKPNSTDKLTATGASAPSPDRQRTPEGLKSTAPIPAEAAINRGMTGASASGGVPQSTFADVKEFNTFSKGLELSGRLGADTAGSSLSGGLTRESLQRCQSKESVRAWTAALPPTAVSISPSALQSLRHTVRSTMASKPEFTTTRAMLSTCELDAKKTLGQQLDVTESMARVEPVRPTKVLYNADYVQWSSNATNCRTTPSKWYNEHPAAPAPPGEHKYPWC